jgi:hypothetical protein
VGLAMVGEWLDQVGQALLLYWLKTMQKRVFQPKTKAVQIQLLPNGQLLTKVKKTDFTITKNSDGTLTVAEKEPKFFFYRSKSVVLANGATQSIPPQFDAEFPGQAHKCVTSDDFLKPATFKEVVTNLKPNSKVVIIGGSHSGFSCAWLLLRGKPSQHEGTKQQKLHTINCSECCVHTSKSEQQCNSCVCKCIGYIEPPQEWPAFETPVEVTLLYRSHIRVFYNNIKEATDAGYSLNNAEVLEDYQNEFVYAFSGLRGDAKQLYTDVVNDKEPRMKLVRAETSRQQLQHIESADLVIWACGYQTKQLPVMDQLFKPVKLSGL